MSKETEELREKAVQRAREWVKREKMWGRVVRENEFTCQNCNGNGYVVVTGFLDMTTTKCKACRGKGQISRLKWKRQLDLPLSYGELVRINLLWLIGGIILLILGLILLAR